MEASGSIGTTTTSRTEAACLLNAQRWALGRGGRQQRNTGEIRMAFICHLTTPRVPDRATFAKGCNN